MIAASSLGPGESALSYGLFADLPAILVRTELAHAAISLFGGHLLSYAPAGHLDLLWLSPITAKPPRPIRGGVPICWPYFARQGQPADAPQHGLVRQQPWQFPAAQRQADGTVVLALAAPALAGVGLEAVLSFSIGRELGMALTTVNSSEDTVVMTQAFHTYLRVGDARQSRIVGLTGLDYSDKFDDFRRHHQQAEWHLQEARDPGRCDRIYHAAGGVYDPIDPVFQRRLAIRSEGSRSVVVWNPGAEAVQGFADIPHEDWPRFLCIEVANCGEDVVRLAPGEAHVLQQTLSVTALS